MKQIIIELVVALLYVVLMMVSYYISIKNRVKNSALDAINKAEDTDKSGAEKMTYAVDLVYDSIPAVAKAFVTKDFIQIAIQAAFDQVEAFAEKQK